MKWISPLLLTLLCVVVPCADASAQDTCGSVCGGGYAQCTTVCYWEGGDYSTCGDQGYECCPRYNSSVIDNRIVSFGHDGCTGFPSGWNRLAWQDWVIHEDVCGGPELWSCRYYDAGCANSSPEPAWCPWCGWGTDCWV